MDPVEGIVAFGHAKPISAVLVSEVREGTSRNTSRRRNVVISEPVRRCTCDCAKRFSRRIVSELSRSCGTFVDDAVPISTRCISEAPISADADWHAGESSWITIERNLHSAAAIGDIGANSNASHGCLEHVKLHS